MTFTPIYDKLVAEHPIDSPTVEIPVMTKRQRHKRAVDTERVLVAAGFSPSKTNKIHAQ